MPQPRRTPHPTLNQRPTPRSTPRSGAACVVWCVARVERFVHSGHGITRPHARICTAGIGSSAAAGFGTATGFGFGSRSRPGATPAESRVERGGSDASA